MEIPRGSGDFYETSHSNLFVASVTSFFDRQGIQLLLDQHPSAEGELLREVEIDSKHLAAAIAVLGIFRVPAPHSIRFMQHRDLTQAYEDYIEIRLDYELFTIDYSVSSHMDGQGADQISRYTESKIPASAEVKALESLIRKRQVKLIEEKVARDYPSSSADEIENRVLLGIIDTTIDAHASDQERIAIATMAKAVAEVN